MRSEHQTCSLHFVHSYAVKDRIEFCHLSSKAASEVNIFAVIPSADDLKCLKSDFTVLVSRLIVEYIPFFSEDYKGLPAEHIAHKFSEEMSRKSEVVSTFMFVVYICMC